jgi:predicted nucleotide-binding protein with TIR-like domain
MCSTVEVAGFRTWGGGRIKQVMRIFIGSSFEQRRLVEWLTAFIRSEYAGRLDPVPWTLPWPGGSFTLENLLRLVAETDAAMLFWTADDKTWYRNTTRNEPRDNLVFEAGLFIAQHGRQRTQLMVPRYQPEDPRGSVAIPSDLAGLTWQPFQWADGAAEATGLPLAARTACDQLSVLGPRPRRSSALQHLASLDTVEEVQTFVGSWATLHTHGIARLAGASTTRSIDVLAVYRVGEIRRVLDSFRTREDATLRACFANVWDDGLVTAYQRKIRDRSADHFRTALKESIEFLLGPCDIQVNDDQHLVVTNVSGAPRAKYEIRLTNQRITFSYYRIDSIAFIVPLDMKTAQNPAPVAWALDRETMPQAFAYYLQEYERVLAEGFRVYPA